MKNKRGLIKIVLILVSLILSIILIKTINDINILPNKYLIIFILIVLIFNIISAFLLFKKKVYHKIISIIIYLLIFIISILGISYGNDTLKFLNNAFNNNSVETTTYGIMVLSGSNIKNVSDIDKNELGYLSTDINNEECFERIDENITKKAYDDLYELYKDFEEKKILVIMLDTAYLEILEDEYQDIFVKIDIIYSFDIETINDVEEKEIKELKPLNIYISGSDSRSNKISNKSRSDVNMILTINPETKTVLMTSIPRDYYVQVNGKKGLKDKLTHSGIYGIDTSRKTLEDLFDIEIDYSIKVGMSSVVEVVDLVGGIDIYSDISFNSYHYPGWRVKKGINHMNGKKALAYSRERYAYRSGDRHRILNQQQVLEAVLKKILTNKTILTKYDELLNSLNNLYRTDIPKEVITLLVKEQLGDMSAWTFESNSVSGSDAHYPTYTAPNSKRYVMIPYEEDVKDARKKINNVLEGR